MNYLFMCEAHSVQAGKHTYYAIFDKIYVSKFPAAHPKLHIAAEIEGDPDTTVYVRLALRNSDETDVMPAQKPMSVPLSAFGTCTIQMDIQGLPLPKAGIYEIHLLQSDRVVGRRKLYVEPLPKGGQQP